MSVSRYRNVPIIDGKHQATFDFPNIDINQIATFSIRISDADRLDTLAARYFGQGELWWVIALLNDIDYSWNFASGQIIKIPVDVNEVLKFF